MSIVVDQSSFPHQVTVKRLSPDDWRLWRSLRLQALAEAPNAFGSTLEEWQGPGDTEARWRDRLTSVPFNLLASWQSGFVGMVSATEKGEDGTIELISLWVASACRGRGIGDLLVNAVVEWATQQNAFYVALDVREDNERAKALYLRRGFVEVAVSSTENVMISPAERRFLHTCPKAKERQPQ